MTEKQFFTDKRLELLGQYPDLIRTEKYGKYCFIPLDIPKFDYPEIVKWFDEAKTPIKKLKPDIATPNVRELAVKFDSVDVVPQGEIEQSDIWEVNMRQDFLELFPNFIKQVMEHFPFKELHRIRLWSSKGTIYYHKDHTKFTDSPTGFRVMLDDTNPEPTLGLIDTLPDEKEDYTQLFTIPRIEETNSFVWSNLRAKHGSIWYPNCSKIVVIMDRWELDVDKYMDLIERSIKKYEDRVMVSTHELKDYVY